MPSFAARFFLALAVCVVAVAAEGRVDFLNTKGLCTVLSASPRLDRLTENQLDDDTLASPAISGGRLFIRGRKGYTAWERNDCLLADCRFPMLKLDAIYNEDCLTGMEKLAADSVDLAFADPPFNIGYDYDLYEDRLEAEKYLDWSRALDRSVVRALRPDGTFWLAIGDEYAAEMKVMLQREHGLSCRSWVVWYYTFGVNCTHEVQPLPRPSVPHGEGPEEIHLQRRRPSVRVPSARQLVYADRRANPDRPAARRHLDSSPPGPARGLQAGRRHLVFSPRVRDVQGAGWLARLPDAGATLGPHHSRLSNEGELVLDPFAGSGGTLAVAKKLGRQFLGLRAFAPVRQANPKTSGRIRPGDPLHGSPEPLVSAPTTANGRRLDSVGDDGPPCRRRLKRRAGGTALEGGIADRRHRHELRRLQRTVRGLAAGAGVGLRGRVRLHGHGNRAVHARPDGRRRLAATAERNPSANRRRRTGDGRPALAPGKDRRPLHNEW